MAYRPPSSSNSGNNDNDDGWKYVSYKKHSEPAPAVGKWGQSALKRPVPPPKTFEQEFPSLGGSHSMKSTTPTISMAERMKQKLAEEEAERQRKAQEKKSTETENPIFTIPVNVFRYMDTTSYKDTYIPDEDTEQDEYEPQEEPNTMEEEEEEDDYEKYETYDAYENRY